jgi:hypothetical protein
MNIEEGGPATSHPFAGRRGGNIQPDDKACDDDQPLRAAMATDVPKLGSFKHSSRAAGEPT